MVRSHCIGPVVVVLALTGLAWGQAKPESATPTSTANPKGQEGESRQSLITIQEQDKPAEKCRVLKAWFLADGSRAFHVQAVNTNELLTIVETGPRSAATPQGAGHYFQAVATRIYHWGSSSTPPEGTPEPPATAPVVAVQPITRPLVTPAERVQLVRPNYAPQRTWPAEQPAVASSSARVWPPAYATSPFEPTAAPAPPVTVAPTATPVVQVPQSDPTVIQGTTTPQAPGKVVPVVQAPQNIPQPQVIQVPEKNVPSTAALAAQTPAYVAPQGMAASTTSPADMGTDAAGPRKPHFGGLFAWMFHSDEPTSAGKTTTVVAQAKSDTLPLALVRDPSNSKPLLQATAAPPVQVKNSQPQVIQPARSSVSAPPATLPLAVVRSVVPKASAPVQAPVKPVLPSMPVAVVDANIKTTAVLPLARVTVPAPMTVPAPIQVAAAPLPLAVVKPVDLPLAVVKPVVPVPPAAQVRVQPKAPETAGNTMPPINVPLADPGKADPFNNLGTFVKVPGEEIQTKLPVPINPPAAQTSKSDPVAKPVAPVAQTASQITPTAAVIPVNPNLPATLPQANYQPGPVSVPVGRQSVMAAQTAAQQVGAEGNTALKGSSPMSGAVQVSAQEGNAFTAPQSPRPSPDPQGNAWTPPSEQLAQANPGQFPQGQPLPQDQRMLPPGQPMLPPQGQPLPSPGYKPYPIIPPIPYQGPAVPMVQQPGLPPEHCPVPCGYANAFTQAGNPRPIPADMGHDPSNTDNAFQSISGATFAVPPGPMCSAPGCTGTACPAGPYGPVPVGMSQPGMGPQEMMARGAPPGAMVANPAMAPVRVSEQQLAQAAAHYQPAPAGPAPANTVLPVGAQTALPGVSTGLPESATLPQLLSLLSDSMYPSQREWAADRLTRFDWRIYPQIVESLLLAAKDDPAPMVRMTSIHSLSRLKAGTTFVVQTLQEMKVTDKDSRVRQEADQALTAFISAGSSVTDRQGSR